MELLEYLDITDGRSFRRWCLMGGHPDKGGANDKFMIVEDAFNRIIKSPVVVSEGFTNAQTSVHVFSGINEFFNGSIFGNVVVS